MYVPFEVIEHTGDAGLVAYGTDRGELLCNAAAGMFSIICEVSKVEPRETVSLELREEDEAYLLADWLGELLFISQTRHMLFGRFTAEVYDKGVRGTASGERFDPARHVIVTEIKAVTCHGLVVERRRGLWTARVIFDL